MHPLRIFTEHPATVGETYFEHMHSATSFAIRMLGGGLACLVHGLFPFLFVKTGSQQVQILHEKMVLNRSKRPTGATSTLAS